MNRGKIAWAVLAVMLAVGLAWQSFRSAHATAGALSGTLAKRILLERQIESAERHLAEVRQIRQDLESTFLGPEGGSKASSEGAKPNNASATADALLMANPKLQILYFNNRRAQQHANLAPFYHAIGLSPEQITKLEDLSMQAQERGADLRWAAETQGTNLSDPTYRALQKQISDQLDSDTRNLLGETGYQQLGEFKRMMPAQYLVGELAVAAAPTDTPLSADQGSRLAQLMSNASSRYQKGGVATLDTISWEVVETRAQEILSVPQMAAFKTTVAKYRESQILTQLGQMVAQAQKN
jgi:hypothetical protein